MRKILIATLILSECLLAGCNAGLGGILLAVFLDEDDDDKKKPPATLQFVDAEQERSRPVDTLLVFTLARKKGKVADVTIEFSARGEPFRPIHIDSPARKPKAAPGQLLNLEASPTGVEHRIEWNAFADLGGDALVDVRLRFTGELEAPILADLVVGNDPPEIVGLSTDQQETRAVQVQVAIADTSSDPVDLTVELALPPPEGAPTVYAAASVAGAIANLATEPDGVAHPFAWAAAEAVGRLDRIVILRVTPTDRVEGVRGKSGTPLERSILLDANDRPSADILEDELLTGGDQRRGIPLRIAVVDAEGDPVDAIVQWTLGGEPYPELDSALDADAPAREALLRDPAARKLLRIATLSSSVLAGPVEQPAAGLELGATEVLASWLKADAELRGLAASTALVGRTVELETDGGETQSRLICSYAPETGILEVNEPFSPPAPPGAHLGIEMGGALGTLRLPSSAGGSVHALVWDGGLDLPGSGAVSFRVTPFDRTTGDAVSCGRPAPAPGVIAGDRGEAIETLGAKRTRGPFRDDDTMAVPLAVVDEPTSLRVGDVDGDGQSDIVCAARGSDALVVLLRRGPGVFQPLRLADAGLVGPSDVVLEDLDQDGDLDIAATGEDSGKVLIIHSQANLDLFTRRTVLSAGGTLVRPTALATADIDADGDPDLAVAQAGGDESGAILFFRDGGAAAGCGAIERGYRPCILADPGNGSPVAIAAAKVDGDDGFDLVTAEPGYFSLYALAISGADVGYTVTRIDAPGADLRSVIVADLDRNGRQDLVGADRAGNSVQIASQDAALGFEIADPLLSTRLSGPVGVASADVDQNGVLDIIVADPGDPATALGGNVCVFLGDGDGAYSADALDRSRQSPATTSSPRAVTLADMDGDGRLDILAADAVAHDIVIFRQGGRGSFRGAPVVLAAGQMLAEPSSLAAGDSDGDARIDLVAASQMANALTVLHQTEAGDFAALELELPARSGTLRRGPVAAALGDVTGDGLADIVAANVDGNDLSVLARDADGAYDLLDIVPADALGPHSVDLADLDGDGQLDVLTAARFSDEARWYRRGAEGEFVEGGVLKPAAGSPASLLGPVFALAADIDGDGSLDVAIASHRSSRISIFVQAETRGTFEAPVAVDLGAGNRPASIDAADLDRNGTMDLVAANLGSAAASLILQAPSGQLSVTSLPAVAGAQPTAVAVRDLGGDGEPDLALAFSALRAGFVQVRNQGEGTTFDGVLRLSAPVIVAPIGLSAADLDQDGEPDLSTANRVTRTVTVFYGGR